MLVGFNTNITYKGTVYHVQTEDSGVKNPVIITLLYQKGAILASKKTSYANLLNDADWKLKAEAIMKQQHHGVIKDLLSGRYTGEAEPVQPESPAEAEEHTEKKLDDLLIDFIIGREK